MRAMRLISARGRLALGVALVALASLALAPAARADFGLGKLDVRFFDAQAGMDVVELHRGEAGPATQAGSHPFALEIFLEVNYSENPEKPGSFLPDGGDIKDLIIEQARGLIGDRTAVKPCATIDFLTIVAGRPDCPDASAVGINAAAIGLPTLALSAAVFNIAPPPGVAVRLGFFVSETTVVIDLGLKQTPHYNVLGGPTNIPQTLTVFGAALQLWGTPADPRHDAARGACKGSLLSSLPEELIVDEKLNFVDSGSPPKECGAEGAAQRPLLTLPRTCEPLLTRYRLNPWEDPGAWVEGAIATGPFQGCGSLEFDPEIDSRATVDSADTGTGLDFEIDFEDEVDPGSEGLTDPDGIAQSDIKEVRVSLPPGVTVNPSVAEGLSVCTPADLERETIDAEPGDGCPEASKLGTVAVHTPLVEEPVEGSVFLARQDDPATAAPGAENPFDSLIAFYIVLRNERLGVLVKQAAKVEPDPETGQLITTAPDIPQIPFSRLRFRFREGQRAPLVTPPSCGTHTTEAEFVPWAHPMETVTRTASFRITRGVGGGPCPPGGVPPFEPGFEAGSLNNSAASYSPFVMRLTRRDGDQDLTKLSASLPRGVLGRLAGVGKCPEALIALARTKRGRAELASPSCPPASEIGHTQAGAGVGSSLTYVPGTLYLAGPHKGAPLSVVSITPAVAGPFDAGTVVVRVALDVDPRTAEVKVDGAASDPIPHILEGIPLRVRDLRVDVDRPGFTLNPTSCGEKGTTATIFGSFLDPLSPADDVPVTRRARYQAANCWRLPFAPRLALRLKGGTRRGANPALRAVLRPRPGHANIERTIVRLPRSAFLDQAHIRTICTRVQFAADRCPRGSIYGRVRAFTPLLEDPLEGPVYLRSSANELPDLVFDLKGLVDIEAAARIDSIRGGIRVIFPAIPDAPISAVVVRMQGGRKGLIVNSRNLCRKQRRNRAVVRLDGHNGKRARLRPVLRAQCKRMRRKAARSSHRRARRPASLPSAGR